jgi:hypothetical protein
MPLHDRHQVFVDAMLEGAERWEAVQQAFSIVPASAGETSPHNRRGYAVTGVAWMRRQDVRAALIAGDFAGELPGGAAGSPRPAPSPKTEQPEVPMRRQRR